MRPYFDHTPSDVRSRLFRSLWPKAAADEVQRPRVFSGWWPMSNLSLYFICLGCGRGHVRARDAQLYSCRCAFGLDEDIRPRKTGESSATEIACVSDLSPVRSHNSLWQISTGAEETLMGTALAQSFGYWVTFSAMMYTVGFIFNTDLTGLQLLTVTVRYLPVVKIQLLSCALSASLLLQRTSSVIVRRDTAFSRTACA